MNGSSDQGAPNNFDFIRLAAALAVLVSHQFAVMGYEEPLATPFQSLGGLAVLMFFSISGYLISQSWVRDPHIGRFIARRFLRIWPGLAVVTLVAAFILGPAVTYLTLCEYFASPQVLDFLQAMILNINYRLPGVFETNPFPEAVNGSLWTIPIEVEWYGVLLIAGAATLLRRRCILLALTAAFSIYTFALSGERDFWNELGAFFCAGACLNAYREVWSPRPVAVTATLAGASSILILLGYGYAALFLMLPFLTIWAGTGSTHVIRQAGRFGDLSYGTYIFAFPTQQTIVWLTSNQITLWQGLAASTVVTLILAYLSWHLVEHPSIQLKRYLRRPGATPVVALLPGHDEQKSRD